MPIHDDFSILSFVLALPSFEQIQTGVVDMPERGKFDEEFGIRRSHFKGRGQPPKRMLKFG